MAEIPSEAKRFKGGVRERVRREALRQLEEASRADKHSVRVTEVRSRAKCEMEAARALVGLWRDGKLSLADSWDDPPPPAPPKAGALAGDPGAVLAQQVREAGSVEDLAAVAQEATARIAEGSMEAETARALKDMIQEARIGRLNWAKEPGAQVETDDERRMVMGSEAGVQVARALDYMVSEERRRRVQEFVARELDQDVLEHPNVDQGGIGA